jgi:hypothetical protein
MKFKVLRSAFLALAGFLLGVGPGTAQAANILVVAGADAVALTTADHLNADLSGTNTVTVVNTGVPASLAGYTQIYDVRYSNLPILAVSEQNAYLDFLKAAPGNVLFLMGENSYFLPRNQLICDFIALVGGGTIAAPTSYSFAPETVHPAFASTPNALTTVSFGAGGVVTSSGNGSFATSEAGGGVSLFFNQGTLANAPTGALVVVFDVNFIATAPTGSPAANEIPFRQNLEAFTSSGGNLGAVPTLTASANPASALTPVTFTAAISGGADGILVSFTDGATQLGTAALASGTASCTASTLAAGTHTVRASYVTSGNVTLNSLPLVEVVNTAPTTLTLASSGPSLLGHAVTFTATLAGVGTPSGQVTFLQDATILGTAALTNSKAIFTTSSLPLGTASITASFPGDANYAPATSNVVSQVVSAFATPTVSASANPSPVFSAVTFTASIPGGADGTVVTFLDGAAQLGTGALASGAATFTTSGLAVGTHAITATYTPGASALTSAPLSVVITSSPTTLALTSSGPSHLGEPVVFTATVAGAGGPTGSIQFLHDTTPLGTAALNSSGVAVLTTAALSAGTDSISASYAGDNNHAAATSNTVSQVVDPTPAIVFPAPPAPSLPVQVGSSATTTFSVASLGTLATPVLLTAAGLPEGATCDFSTNAVDVSGGPVAITATFTTTRPLIIIGKTQGTDLLGGVGAAAMLGCGVLALTGNRRRRRLGIFLPVLAVLMLGGMAACSSHNSSRGAIAGAGVGTPPGTYPVTITASSQGATQATVTVQLVVN